MRVAGNLCSVHARVDEKLLGCSTKMLNNAAEAALLAVSAVVL
jgi:hypothetical protein